MQWGVFPILFSSYARKGIYCFRFYKNSDWKYVIIGKHEIDSRIPCLKSSRKPVFASSTN